MSIADIADDLLKEFGGNRALEEPQKWLDSGFKPLNKIISNAYGGGMPQARITEIFGPSKSGKTLIATQVMIAAQQAGGCAIFVDWERAFNPKFAEDLGLNTTFPYFFHLQSETWESGHNDAMRFAEKVRTSKSVGKDVPIVIVFDSIAAAVPKSVFEKGIDEYTMNDTTALARVSSTTLKTINALVSRLDVTAIYLNQIRTKPGVAYGDPTTTPGGSAMEFYASLRLSLSAKRIVEKTGAEKELVGKLIEIKIKKSKMSKEDSSVSLRLAYDDDGRAHFDYTGSLLDYLVEVGLIKEAGGRVTWTDGKVYWRKQLVERINAESLYTELEALLPADVE